MMVRLRESGGEVRLGWKGDYGVFKVVGLEVGVYLFLKSAFTWGVGSNSTLKSVNMFYAKVCHYKKFRPQF